jgi:glycosyltransferase involved in cell wall biosynthesis
VKIVTIHNRYRSAAPSGENRVVDREREALLGLGHEVVPFERHSDEIESWPKVKQATLPVQLIWSRETYRDLTAMLRAQRPDVVHVHNTFPLLSPAVLHACRAASVPVVATLHNKRLVCASGDFYRNGTTCHDCAPGAAAPALRHGCYRGSRLATIPVVLGTKVHRQAWGSLVSAYVFVSASLRDQLAGLNLDPERVFVRHHLIPSRSMPQVTHEPAIFYAGRLDEAKGLRVLMDGWDRYLRTAPAPGLRLVIAGSGPLEREVAHWASGRSSVELVGQVDGDRCTDLMSRSSAVVLPSIVEETFGLVAVEAMAVGVAPIAAGHGAFTELISSGADGVLFQPGNPAALADVITDVSNDPDRYAGYGKQARATYEERFDPGQNLEQLLEIYRFAIAHPVR